jgi:hypothetical protein
MNTCSQIQHIFQKAINDLIVEIHVEEIAKVEVLKNYDMLFLTIYLVSGAIFIAFLYARG